MSALVDGLASLAAVAWVVLQVRIGLVAARMFQIEEYEVRRFLTWGRTREWLGHRAVTAGALATALGTATAVLAQGHSAIAAAAGWLAAGVAGNFAWQWSAAKRPLVVTARMRRLLIGAAAVTGGVAAVAALLITSDHAVGGGIVALAIAGGATLFAQVSLVAGNALATPVEATVRRHYLDRARRRIAEVDPLVIAIAGSYGKTSTKRILAHLLDDDHHVLATRKSFNTLMGITRVINEDLRPEHRIFVVEMDAYGPGEIASMCDLVHPRFAIVTSVGPQHLERFGTLARIAGALYEVVASLPRDGAVVIHVGDEEGAALLGRARAEGRRALGYAIADEPGGADADVTASSVRIDGHGTRFHWRWTAEHEECAVGVPLLGRHQALNVSASLAMARLLGRPLDAAVAVARTLRPIEHRLQPLESGGAVTVLDDSYNANPVGVHSALDVLAAMDGRWKILVTPGLVELGSVEEVENRRYGAHAGAVCDHVIVVEARPARALLAGLRESGIEPSRVHVVQSLAGATAVIGRVAGPGDVVLFANDLPDTYLPPVRPLTGTASKAGG